MRIQTSQGSNKKTPLDYKAVYITCVFDIKMCKSSFSSPLRILKRKIHSILIIYNKQCTAHSQEELKIKLLNISTHSHALNNHRPKYKTTQSVETCVKQDEIAFSTPWLWARPSAHLAKVGFICLDRQQYDPGAKYSVGTEEHKAGNEKQMSLKQNKDEKNGD